MKKYNSFTLVELLAVIVILAVILAIAIPSITGVVNNAKRNAFEDNAKMFLKAVDYKLMQDSSYDVTRIKKNTTEDTINTELNLNGSNYKTVTVTLVNNEPTVDIIGDNKWDGLEATGTYKNITVSTVEPDTSYYVYNNGYNSSLWEEGLRNFESGTATFTKETDHMYLSLTNNLLDGATFIISTTQKIDLTSYNKLRYDSDGYVNIFYIGNTKITGFMGSPFDGLVPGSDAEGYYWDISSYDGEYYLLWELGIDSPGTVSGNIYKVWLE